MSVQNTRSMLMGKPELPLCPTCRAQLEATIEPSGAYGSDEWHLHCAIHGEQVPVAMRTSIARREDGDYR